MQHLTYVVSMSLPGRDCAGQHGYWFGNGTGCAHAYKIRKWRPSQQTAPGQCFFDHSKFEAIKSLSGWKAAHSDEAQFHAKINS